MAAIRMTASGDFLYLALEDTITGNQFVIEASKDDLNTWQIVYDPMAGTACNIISVPANPDKMLFYGNFGTDITVILWHSVDRAYTDISPASLGAKVVNACATNPADENQIIITVGTDQDLLYSSDGGSNWTAWDAALGFDATALTGIWSSKYGHHRYMVAGDNITNLDLIYSANQGGNKKNLEDTGLAAAAAITNIEVVNG